jgi:hypothetical protein
VSFLSSLFVHKPFNILIVGALFAGFYAVLRFCGSGEKRRPAFLLVPAGLWGVYAAWEWFVTTMTPEANIRVDMMLIWPVIVALSIGFVVKALRGTATRSRT